MSIEKIDEVDLEALVKDASSDLILQRRKEALTLIQKLMCRIEGLAKEKKQADTKVKELEGKITAAQEKLNKIKSGDWSILAGLEKELQDKPQDKIQATTQQ